MRYVLAAVAALLLCAPASQWLRQLMGSLRSRRTFSLSLAAAMFLVPGSLAAQPACAPYPAIVEHLAKQFGEHPVSQGGTDNGLLAQLFASDGGKTWTFVVIRPDGIGCVVQAGENWRSDAVKPGKDA